jgi:hypothetical protein
MYPPLGQSRGLESAVGDPYHHADKGIYKKMGMKQLIRALGKHRVQEIGETRIVFPETKEQRQINEAFRVDVPVQVKFPPGI